MFTPPAVIDTNVFVGAAFNPDSSSAQIIDAIRDGRLVLVWNEQTRRETLHVLQKIPPVDESQFTSLFDDKGHYDGPIHPQRFQLVEDRSDRKFAAIADATGTVVVSNDSDLLEVRDELDIVVRSPSKFITHSGVFDEDIDAVDN